MALDNLRVLRKIRKEFDYQDYLDSTVPVKYSGNGELRVCCPNCLDRSYKLYVNNDTKRFNCFKCDFNNGNFDVFDFVSQFEGITRAQAMMRLAREYAEIAPSWESIIEACKTGIYVDEDVPNASRKIKTIRAMPQGSMPLTDKDDPEQKPFWDYLLKRGFTEGEITAVKSHYVPAEHLFIKDANNKIRGNIGRRVLFPVYGGDNDLVSWLARATDDRPPKYFNAPDSEASRTLWPYVPCHGDMGIIVEGLIDSLALRRHGFNSYATLGKKISYDQIELLKHWGVTEVVLFWDKKDAKKEMLKAIETLKLHFDDVLVPDLSQWPADKDSGDTLNWEAGALLLKDMLTQKLIDVNSLEFATWQLS